MAEFGDVRLPERFWSKVDPSTGCWVWTATRNAHGYGVFHKWRGRSGVAHRFAYSELIAELPAYTPRGVQLDHLCRNRACVNPEHLEPVTPQENTLRGETIAARRAGQTHCVNGHEFTVENIALDANGNRACRECHRRHGRNRKRRLAEQRRVVEVAG